MPYFNTMQIVKGALGILIVMMLKVEMNAQSIAYPDALDNAAIVQSSIGNLDSNGIIIGNGDINALIYGLYRGL